MTKKYDDFVLELTILCDKHKVTIWFGDDGCSVIDRNSQGIADLGCSKNAFWQDILPDDETSD